MIYYRIIMINYYLLPSFYQKNSILQIFNLYHLLITSNIQNNNALHYSLFSIFKTFFISHIFYLLHHFITYVCHYCHLYLKISIRLIIYVCNLGGVLMLIKLFI